MKYLLLCRSRWYCSKYILRARWRRELKVMIHLGWTLVDPPSMAWDPPGGPNWKLPGVVHTHPEVRQQWVNTAEGMQEARIRAKHLEKQTTRMQR